MAKLGLVATAAWSAPALAPVVPPISDVLGIPRRLPTGARGVALTFDDGPHPEGTPALLDLLGEAGARATFFLVGEQVERWPRIAARVALDGHVVAIHGYRHRNLLRIPPAVLSRDLERAAGVIEQATGHAPSLYRPPYGIFSPAALAMARRRGWDTLLWSRWGHDWRRHSTAASIAGEVTANLSHRDVILLHDADHYSSAESWRNTLAAMPQVLETLARSGLSAVTPESTSGQPGASR